MRVTCAFGLMLVVLALSIMFHSIVQACSFVIPVVVRCSATNEYGKTILTQHYHQDRSGDVYFKQMMEDAHKKLSELDAVCEEDLAPIMTAFEQKYIEWIEADVDGGLLFEPYSVDQEKALQTSQRDLLSCWQSKFERLDDWLISTGKYREYCYEAWLGGVGECPDTVFSVGLFLMFLIRNLNLVTAISLKKSGKSKIVANVGKAL